MTSSSERSPRGLPRLHLVTDAATVARPGFLAGAKRALGAGGVNVALHLRAPGTSARILREIGGRVAALCAETGALLVVNDRVDVALAIGAGGVQLGRGSFDVPDARRLLGPGPLIGVSVHPGEPVDEAADFALAGTLFATASHPGRAGSGTAWLGPLVARGLPVIGIGGITPERVPAVLEAGAYGVAVVRAVWSARDPGAAVTEILNALG
ncbi:MAG TPA: thiamine phosphate synthase [Longimicrobiaceae bacterium]|nr:thiamine phosphate synthase [Longimicrobiaceae bacterium]